MTDKKDDTTTNVTDFADAKLSKEADEVTAACKDAEQLMAMIGGTSAVKLLAAGYDKASRPMQQMLDGVAQAALVIDVPLADSCAHHGNVIDAAELSKMDSLATTFTKALDVSVKMPKAMQIDPRFANQLGVIAAAIDEAVDIAAADTGSVSRFAYGKLSALHAELCSIFENIGITKERAVEIAEFEKASKGSSDNVVH